MVFSRRLTGCWLNVKGGSRAVYGLTGWFVNIKPVKPAFAPSTRLRVTARQERKRCWVFEE